MRRRLVHLSAVLGTAGLICAGLAAAPVATASGPVAGSTSGGDPYFPAAGNGGYQISHYDLNLRYEPASKALTARANLVGTTFAALRSFSLDLRDLTVSAVTVNGRTARFAHADGELVVTPSRPLPAHAPFVVTVAYGGTTGQPEDNTGALYGWVSYADGAFVANEPEGASTWYPVNDVPYDKATYSFAVTVPDGTVAVGNGELLSQRTKAGWTTWRWLARDPMASYLSMAATGDYTLTTTRTASGLPIINAVDEDLTPAQKARADASLALQPEMVEFFSGVFGPYPFTSFGAVVDDDRAAGYALENQTRPIYSGAPSEGTVAHELAHQWYGDKVTPKRWKDIWLNEGFAVYAEWLWSEHRGQGTVQERFDEAYAVPAEDEFWQVVIGDPGATGLFEGAVYDRGAMFLQALRTTIGDDAFFTVLRRWAGRSLHLPATTEQLEALAEKVSHRQLDALFDTWLYTPGKPALPSSLAASAGVAGSAGSGVSSGQVLRAEGVR
jgi:aminopeptidase N